MSDRSAELAEAIEQQARLRSSPHLYSLYRPFPTSLRSSYRPPKRSQPTGTYVPVEYVPAVSEASRDAEMVATVSNDTVATPAAKSEVEPVWQAVLDINVWRSRPWWWRLAASLVVKRLGR
jgi:hypothetical protein